MRDAAGSSAEGGRRGWPTLQCGQALRLGVPARAALRRLRRQAGQWTASAQTATPDALLNSPGHHCTPSPDVWVLVKTPVYPACPAASPPRLPAR